MTSTARIYNNTPASQDQFRLAIDTIPGLVWTAEPNGYIDFLNQRWCEYTGLTMEEAIGWGWQSAVCPMDLPGLVKTWKEVLTSGAPGEAIARLRRADGEDRWFLFRAVPLYDETGQLLKWYGQTTDIDERKRVETLLAGEKQLLEMIAKGVALPRVLDALCLLIEETTRDAISSILLVDADGIRLNNSSAPSLSSAYRPETDFRLIAEHVSPCASAAFMREQVVAADFAVDDGRWPDTYRERALAHGLRACWSTPIESSTGELLGTFAIFFRKPGSPSPEQRDALQQCSSIASIAVERSLTQAALEESEGRFRQLADALPEVIWITELHPQKFLYLSPSFERIWGRPAEELFREPELWLTSIHPEDLARVANGFGQWTAGRDVDYSDFEFRIVQPGGAVRWIHERGVLHRDGDGKPFRVSGISTDITDRKHAEEALRRSEAYQAEAQRLSLTGSFSWCAATGELIWSEETYRIFGCDPADPLTLEVARERIHPDDREYFDETARNAAADGKAFNMSHRLRMPDGTVKFVSVVTTPVKNFATGHVEHVGAVQDNTERRRVARDLRRARMRAMEARYAAMMAERTRLAREIHDTLLQGFNGVALMLMAAARKVTEPPEAMMALQHVLDLAQSTLGDARRSVWEMRAPAIAGDFVSVLRKASDEAVRGTMLALDFVLTGAPRPITPVREAAAVRVVQEAIANAIKHAGASKVRVRVSFRARSVRVSVRDNGCGFTVDPDFRGYGGHWGLLGMWERANQVGARLKVRSAASTGTEVLLALPQRSVEMQDAAL